MVDTVKTIKPSGGDYTSLSAWEAGQQKVIASGDTEQAECYAMSDTTAVTINGWTTASDAYIRIYTPASERHDGKWNTAKYRLEVAGTVLTVEEENVRLDGLQVFMTNTASSFLYGIILSGITGVADFRIENCLVRASDEIGANCNGVYLAAAGAGSVVRMKNTAVYGFYSTGDFDAALRGGTANITAYLYNCVFVRGNYGVLSNPGVFNCTNCYAGATDHGAYVIGGGSGGTINRTTSASSDATGSAGLQNIAYSTTAGAYFANITVGSEDFHIGASSALKDVGTDLSADANYAFTDDIDGQTRSGTWDIGADEIVAAAGGSAASADGVGDAAAVGASTASASASSDGVSTTIATGASTATADYSANGDVPVAVFVGTSAVLGAASSDGVGDAQAVGSSTASSNYSADGEATTVAEGAGTATAVYAADGEGAATATGASTAASNYLAEGDVPTAVMVGDSVAAGQAAASSDGVGTATAEGASTAASAYTSDGEATAIADATSGSAPVVEEDVESGSSPQGGGYYAHNPWREYKKKRDKTLDLEEQEIIEIAMLAAQQITADYMNHGIS